VQGIAELITRSGLINVDFADVRTVMSEMGMAMMGSGLSHGEHRARVAAEAAIASPLLEDIDIAGARGILVNVTAGPDLSIGEFDEVGNTVKLMAAEDATVVVGTVIDNDMGGDLRVTLVATGLGARVSEVVQKPAVKLVEKRASGEVDYGKLERPTVMRNEARAANKFDQDYDLDYLDIPAFLRRQAD
jgi:cell division protein FtsZ